MSLAEKVFGLPLSPTKRAEQQVGNHRISYAATHVAATDASLSKFFQRTDVNTALPYFFSRRQIQLKTKEVIAPDGSLHSYHLLQQGRKKFLFAEEENPLLLANLPENPLERQKDIEKRLSFTLAVPQADMQDLLPKDGQSFRRLNHKKVRHLSKMAEKKGAWMIRGNPEDLHGLENNTDFIQPIPAAFVENRKGKIQLPTRGHKSHDQRLGGQAVLSMMEHSDPIDLRRIGSVIHHARNRGFAEETLFKKGEKTFHVFPRRGESHIVTPLGMLRFRRHIKLEPFGIVYVPTTTNSTQESRIGTVHAGIVFRARERRNGVSLVPFGHETMSVMSISADDYSQAVERGELKKPSTWLAPIIKHVHEQRQKESKPTKLKQTVQQAFAILKAAL